MATVHELTSTPDNYADGTYMVDAHGDLHLLHLSEGYMVGKRSLNGPEEAPRLSLVGKWTNESESVYYGPGEYDYETKDVIYWDEVECIHTFYAALVIAADRGELAIWDNANGVEIRV